MTTSHRPGSALLLLLLTALCFGTAAFAQLEVPVVYTLTSASKPVEGVLTGGSLCDAEGLSVKDASATSTRVVAWETIDRVEELNPIGSNKLLMKVVLKDGHRFQAYATIPETDPLLILRDEQPEGATATPKLRTFTKANFKGLYLLEIEAEPPAEVSDEEVLKQVNELGQAIGQGDLDKAIDLHNKIGDFIEAWQDEETGEDGDSESSTGEEPTTPAKP